MPGDVQLANVRALVFDVFGTLVDWRSGVARRVEACLDPGVDAGAFADAWRGLYQTAMSPVRDGTRSWVDLDVLHAENLEIVLRRFGITDVSAVTRQELVNSWHQLDAWPDVAEGLRALRRSFLLAPLSNGHVALSVALARRNDFRWDAILGAEVARNYKPAPDVYLGGAASLGLRPDQLLMIACHSDDLAAASALGLRTAHIARPNEKGPGLGEVAPAMEVDIAAANLGDLADRMRRLTDAA